MLTMLKRCWFLAYTHYTTKRLHTPFEDSQVMLYQAEGGNINE